MVSNSLTISCFGSTAGAMHGDAMSGFWQGYGIAAMNHTGDKIKGDNGQTYTLSSEDAVVIGHRSSTAIISSLIYSAKYMNVTRTQGTLNAYNSKGTLIGEYQATSGSGRTHKFTIPQGKFSLSGYTSTTDPKFMRNDIGFKIKILPDPVWDPNKGDFRRFLLVHPARYNGTEGCIGLIGEKSEIFKFQQQWTATMKTTTSIPLTVIYK